MQASMISVRHVDSDQRVKKKLVLEGFEIKPTEKKDRILF